MKNRVFKSSDFETGNVPYDMWKDIREYNESPVFTEIKQYKFIEKIKSDTRNFGWLFEFEEKYYIALQHKIHNCTDCVSIYTSDKKQTFDGSMMPIVTYVTYVDLELAADKFTNELTESLNTL
jgi:hypothetical protein